jgi:hypothetical protein
VILNAAKLVGRALRFGVKKVSLAIKQVADKIGIRIGDLRGNNLTNLVYSGGADNLIKALPSSQPKLLLTGSVAHVKNCNIQPIILPNLGCGLSGNGKVIRDQISGVEVASYDSSGNKIWSVANQVVSPIEFIKNIQTGNYTRRLNRSGNPVFYGNREGHSIFNGRTRLAEYEVPALGNMTPPRGSPMRIIVDESTGDMFFSPDHYKSIIPINK